MSYGLVAVGQCLDRESAVHECRRTEPDASCRGCGTEVTSCALIARRLAHEPFGHRPTTLLVRVRRYRCSQCSGAWREVLTAAAEMPAKLSRRGIRWALEAIVIDHLRVARAAAGLGVSWHTASNAILAEGHRVLIDDPGGAVGSLRSVSMNTSGDTPGTAISTSPSSLTSLRSARRRDRPGCWT